MYFVEIDPQGEIQRISQQLGTLSAKAPNVLVNSLNATATRANTLIKKAIKQRYTYQRKDKLKEGSKVQRASKQHLDATITFTVRDEQHITDFKHSPTVPSKSDYGAAKAQVLQSGGMKALKSKLGTKAFTIRFSNGKAAIVQRVPGETYKSSSALATRLAKYGKGADPTRIKAFYGPRLTSMAKAVYEEDVQADIRAILDENIQKRIAQTIEKAMEG